MENNCDYYRKELKRINSSKNWNKDINQLIKLYSILEEDEKSFYASSFKYAVYNFVLNWIKNIDENSEKWVILWFKNKIQNILNHEPDFDFSVLKNDKLNKIVEEVLDIKVIRI